ncbi:MAG: choice-of-anchor J domain-containing protein [Paludibacter sp.]
MKKNLLSLAVVVFGISVGNVQATTKNLPNKGTVAQTQVVNASQSNKSFVLKSPKNMRNLTQAYLKNAHYHRLAKMRTNLNTKTQNLHLFKSRTPLMRMKASADTTLYEGFEAYDGIAKNWIPANWTRLNKTNTTYLVGDSINPTWSVNPENSYTNASLGSSMAWIDWDQTPSAQDSWLVSPVFTPKAGDYLNFDCFYNPFWMYYDYNNSTNTTDAFNFTVANASIACMISTDNGATWTKLWDALDDAGQFNETNIQDFAYSAGSWNTIQKTLAAYVGKSVKIAFRYYGKDGDSMGLDEIAVRQLKPAALYNRPQGYFYMGLTTDFKNAPNDLILGNPYEAGTWSNFSNMDARSFNWTLSDPTNKNASINSNDIHATVTYPSGEFTNPLLKASAEGKDSTYTWGTLGNSYLESGGNGSGLGIGNYDLSKYIAPYTFAANDYVFGTRPDSTIDAIANFFDKPIHRYVLDSMWVSLGAFSAPAGTEFKLILRRVVDYSLADTIAIATCKAEDVINNSGYYSMVFKGFVVVDPTTGLDVTNDYLEISDAMLVELTGFNKPGITLGAYSQAEDSPTGESNAYIYYLNKTAKTRKLYNSSDYIGYNISLLFNMAATYSYIHPDATLFEAPVAGGSKTFNIDSWYSPDEWWLDTDLPSWLTSQQTFDETTWGITYTLKAEPLPAGVTGRGTVVKVSTYGADMSINVNQGDYTGISDTKMSNTCVLNQVNSFDLKYSSEFTSVSIYNVSGQLMSDYKLPTTGKLTIPVNGLTKGLYLFKFIGNNSQTVKVVR